jgi:NADPH2:quinone reductase
MTQLFNSPPQWMRSAVLTQPGTIEIQEIAVPRPAAGEVLVRIEGCGVCASNLAVWEGKPWFNYPLESGAPGHEAYGWVESVGAGVDGFERGQRVAMLSSRAYSEFDVASESNLVALPEALDGMALPGEPLGCAMNIFHRAQIKRRDTVAIVGAGFLGILLTQLVAGIGARAIVLARKQSALDWATRFGASETVQMTDQAETVERVRELTAGGLCQVCLEVTGKQSPLNLAAELTAEHGRLVIAGYHQDGPREVNLQLWNWRGLDVINAHERDPQVYIRGMRAATEAILSGRLTPNPLLTHRLPLKSLGLALNMAMERPEGFMKAIVTP